MNAITSRDRRKRFLNRVFQQPLAILRPVGNRLLSRAPGDWRRLTPSRAYQAAPHPATGHRPRVRARSPDRALESSARTNPLDHFVAHRDHAPVRSLSTSSPSARFSSRWDREGFRDGANIRKQPGSISYQSPVVPIFALKRGL